jgi:TolB-like protein/DNA-binding winged helix-turn-helix (wHTH) protein/Tfp pilus assembly protein PilF
MPDAATRYCFGPFVLDPAIRQLSRERVPVTLPPKAFDILVLLVRTRDRVISKPELLDTIWPDTAVIENTLTQRIREIREALGDDAQQPQWIKTVARVGYRFIGEVVEEKQAPAPAAAERAAPEPVPAPTVVESPGAPPADAMTGTLALPIEAPAREESASSRRDGRRTLARPVIAAAVAVVVLGALAAWSLESIRSSPSAAEPRIESIAVLPLENLSSDADQDYFADGMTDELIAELARNPALRVISRTSVLRYRASTKSVREIGRELEVDGVVEGSVLRAGSQARITLKLVEVASDRTLLAESYTRELQDILALQSHIARALADRVRVTVAPGHEARLARRVVPEAYDEYLRGRAAWNTRTREGVSQALASFRRAIDRSPTYAAAWAGVADCYIVFSGALLGLPENEAYPKAREAALRALALDETLPEAHTSLGSVKSEFDWDWPGAEAEYTRAIALNSSYVTARHWYGAFLYFQGRHDESLIQLRHARELDPLSPVVNSTLATGLLLARRYDEALAQAQRTIEIDPGFAGAYLTLGSVYLQKGVHTEAIAALQRAVSLSPGLSRAPAWLGHAYAVAGQAGRARQTLAELQALSKQIPVSPYDIALIHAALGDPGQAFAWLERAYQARAWDLVLLKVDMRFDSLRSDPRFTTLLERIGLSS